MFGSILIAVIILSILILAHEFGHYFAAKRAGIWVEEFGIGLPPRLMGKKIGETVYSINLLPIGGFVRLHGEHTDEGVTKSKKAFINKSKKIRSIVIVAGVLMNVLLAVVAFSIVYSFSGIPKEGENVRVVEIASGSPADKEGLMVNDYVREVEGQKITSTKQFIASIGDKKGEEVSLLIEREGSLLGFTLTPRSDPPEGEGALGVTITSTETYFPPIWQRPFIGAYFGIKEAFFWIGTVLLGFITIITDLFAGKTPKDIAGPVGIVVITAKAASFGILPLINITGFLSINLAILNIIPFPALDGGRLFFIGVESVFGKKVLPKVEAALHTVGIMLLLLLIFAITAYDIRRISTAGGISQYIDSVLK